LNVLYFIILQFAKGPYQLLISSEWFSYANTLLLQ
jgi:hypothetical protein